MKYQKLGKSKIKINSIGLGTNFVKDIRKDEKNLIYLLQKALDLKINFFDTAESYHTGYSENLIGKAFKKQRDKVIFSTKFSSEHCGYKEVLKSADGSLKRLQTDYIDLYQIHWPNSVIPIEQTLKALEKLVRDGKVINIGVCNFSLRQLKNVQAESRLSIVSLQTEYNLIERSIERDLLPYCERNKIITIAYTPLNSGNILKNEKYSKLLLNIAKKYNKTPSQIILNFLISHPSVVAIPATTNLIHLEENARANEFMLEKDDVELIAKTFITKVLGIETNKIRVSTSSDHAAYKTLEEAMNNKLNFFPSPKMLSLDLQEGDFLKPVKVRRLEKKVGSFEYELLNGRIRYWAHVLAFSGKKPIPAIIE